MIEQSKANGFSAAILAAATIFLLGLAPGCSQTVAPQAGAITGAPPTLAYSGFLGNHYPDLKPGKEGQAVMVYINPDAQWSGYDKIMLAPVEYWADANSTLPSEDQRVLTTYFYNKLKEDLGKQFTLVDQPGPGVMKVEAALTDATASTPVLRSVSVVIPQARLLNSAQSLATGSYSFVGSAQGELKITDSTSGRLLAASVDKRLGGMALSTAAQWKWGDAEDAMNYWAEKITSRLVELRSRQAQQAKAR